MAPHWPHQLQAEDAPRPRHPQTRLPDPLHRPDQVIPIAGVPCPPCPVTLSNSAPCWCPLQRVAGRQSSHFRRLLRTRSLAGSRQLPPHLHRGRVAPGADGVPATGSESNLTETRVGTGPPPLNLGTNDGGNPSVAFLDQAD